MKLGIDFLDENISETELTDKMTVLYSRFGHGKTTFLIKILSNVCKIDGKRILYVNFDYSPKHLIKKITHCLSDIPLGMELGCETPIMKYGIKLKYIGYDNVNELINYLEKNIGYDMIIVDGCDNNQIDKLIEFKKSFKNVLLVSTQLHKLIGDENKNSMVNKDLNVIVLERDIYKDYSQVSIRTEAKNVSNLEIDFDPRTFKMNKI